jgi:hypothetical protein
VKRKIRLKEENQIDCKYADMLYKAEKILTDFPSSTSASADELHALALT